MIKKRTCLQFKIQIGKQFVKINFYAHKRKQPMLLEQIYRVLF